MKRKNLLSLGVIAAALTLTLGACQTTPETPSNNSSVSVATSSTEPEVEITKVEVNGPSSVKIGGTITLTAGVTGDSENRVTWSSENPDIAAVDASGKVTGVSAGTATIVATSVLDPNKKGEFTVTVTPTYQDPKAITPTISDDQAEYDQENGVYLVDLYSEFDVTYTLDVEDPTPAQSVVYRLLTGENGESYESFLSVDADTGHCVSLLPIDDPETVLTIQVEYRISDTQVIYGTLRLKVVDHDQETIDGYAERLAEAQKKELEEASSAEVTRKIKSANKNIDRTIHYTYGENATYATISEPEVTNYGSSLKTTNNYSGIQSGRYYSFSYTSSYGYTNLREVYATGDAEDYKDVAGLPLNYDDGKTYGLVNNALNILTGSDYFGAPAVSADEARRNMRVSEQGNTLGISSVFTTPGTQEGEVLDNSVSLTLNIDEEGYLNFYSFSSVVLSEGDVIDEVYESASIDYGSKASDDQVNVDSFLVTGIYGVTNMAGRSDDGYSFTGERYLPQTTQPTYTEYEGRTYSDYAMNPSQTFALQLSVSPSPAALELDDIKVTITPISYTIIGNGDEEDVTPETPLPVCNVASLGEGIYTVSNAFTENENSVKGSSLITFTSSKGYSYSFIATYTDFGEPTSIRLEGFYGTDFGTIVQGGSTSVFSLNTSPAGEYEYVLNVTDTATDQPAPDALTLTRPEDISYGNTDWVVKGNIPGTYSFTISVEGYPEVSTQAFTVTVVEPLSDEDIAEKVLTQTYEYGSNSQMMATFSFDTENSELVITQNNYGVVYVDRIPYTVQNGAIALSGGTQIPGATGTYYQLGTNIAEGENNGHSNPSFGYIRTDEPIKIALDTESLSCTMMQYGYSYAYPVTFYKHYDNPLLRFAFDKKAYYSFYDGTSSVSYQVGVKFNEDLTGKFTIYNSDGSEKETIEFTYTIEQGDYSYTVSFTATQADGDVGKTWPATFTGSFIYYSDRPESSYLQISNPSLNFNV